MNDTVGIAHICRALSARPPRLAGDEPAGRAAVAIVLHETEDDGVRVLIIERARHDGDPWSGDLAFPGGRLEPDDADEQTAAERETLEEVGLDLSGARLLGRLDDRAARILPLTVCAFVYAVDTVSDLVISDEVSEAFWIGVADLVDPDRHCEHRLSPMDARRFPAIDLLGPGRPLLWGVTYFFLCEMLCHLGHRLPQSAPA